MPWRKDDPPDYAMRCRFAVISKRMSRPASGARTSPRGVPPEYRYSATSRDQVVTAANWQCSTSPGLRESDARSHDLRQYLALVCCKRLISRNFEVEQYDKLPTHRLRSRRDTSSQRRAVRRSRGAMRTEKPRMTLQCCRSLERSHDQATRRFR